MKLRLLNETKDIPLFHGVSNQEEEDVGVREKVVALASSGFHEPQKGWGVFFTPKLNNALSYRRELDYSSDFEDYDFRGIIEINKSQIVASNDGDAIMTIEPINDNRINKSILRQWKYLYEMNIIWSENERYDYFSFENEDGSWDDILNRSDFDGIDIPIDDPYFAAQHIANYLSGLGISLDYSGISTQDKIDPNQIAGAYLFKMIDDDNYQCQCVEIIKQGSIKLGHIETMGERVDS